MLLRGEDQDWATDWHRWVTDCLTNSLGMGRPPSQVQSRKDRLLACRCRAEARPSGYKVRHGGVTPSGRNEMEGRRKKPFPSPSLAPRSNVITFISVVAAGLQPRPRQRTRHSEPFAVLSMNSAKNLWGWARCFASLSMTEPDRQALMPAATIAAPPWSRLPLPSSRFPLPPPSPRPSPCRPRPWPGGGRGRGACSRAAPPPAPSPPRLRRG